MWAILKINNNKYKMLTKSLNAELKSKAIFYFPKVIIQKIKLNKKKSTQCSVLGNYIFCYHDSFENPKNIEKLKFTHGLKYFLKDYNNYQKDITEFINYCKNNENTEGFLNSKFFFENTSARGKFLNGPFSNMFFDIIEKEKQKLKIIVGNINVSLSKNSKYSYLPS